VGSAGVFRPRTVLFPIAIAANAGIRANFATLEARTHHHNRLKTNQLQAQREHPDLRAVIK
jgi:hypothetical protein